MFKSLYIFGLLAVTVLPARANENNLPKHLSPCISEGLNQIRRPRDIQKVEVYTSYIHLDKTYFKARVTPVSEGGWSLALSLQNNQCDFIGDDFVDDSGLLYGVPDEVRVPWAKRDILKRLETVSRQQFLKDVEAYGGLQPYEYQAMRELDLID